MSRKCWDVHLDGVREAKTKRASEDPTKEGESRGKRRRMLDSEAGKGELKGSERRSMDLREMVEQEVGVCKSLQREKKR